MVYGVRPKSKHLGKVPLIRAGAMDLKDREYRGSGKTTDGVCIRLLERVSEHLDGTSLWVCDYRETGRRNTEKNAKTVRSVG